MIDLPTGQPNHWTGIAPNGDVITSDHQGNAINHGPYQNLK